jgi:type I restriction enzyme, S subunit
MKAAMKKAWQNQTIGAVCEVVNGGTPKTGVAAYWGGVHEWITPAEMGKRRSPLVSETERTLTDLGLANSSASPLPPYSVILSSRAPIGHLVINTVPMATNQGCKGLVPGKALNHKFLYYYLVSIVDLLNDLGTGATFRELSGGKLKEVTIPVPPLPEQQRIVGILDESFSGIATAKANADKNLQNARALFESYLQSVFTQRGSGWVEKSVGELVAEGALVKPFDGNHGEIHPRKADYTESGVPFIMACDLKNGDVDTEDCKFISRKLADTLRVGFAMDGDVLISHKGTIGRSAVVSTEDEYIMLTPQVTSYRVKDVSKLFNRFIRCYFMSPVFQREMIAGAADGATRAYIGITKQLSLRFRFPALAEQKRIAAKLDVLGPKTQRLESIYQQKLAALDALKKSLLQQAFTGQL